MMNLILERLAQLQNELPEMGIEAPQLDLGDIGLYQYENGDLTLFAAFTDQSGIERRFALLNL